MDFFQQLFRRYLKGNTDRQEQELVDRWYDATGEGRPPCWMTKQQINQSARDAWQQMTVNLGLEAPFEKPVKQLWLRWSAAAAVIVSLGTWAAYYYMDYHPAGPRAALAMDTWTAAKNTTRQLFLKDGTGILLNHATSIKVPKYRESDSTREIWLTEGEAYFTVARDAAKPFIVHIDSLQVRVLGTSFNIRAYRSLPQVLVSVRDGAVQVANAKGLLDTLTRNRQLSYLPANGSMYTISKDLQQGWWDHRFVLDNAAFEELALRMQLKYGLILQSRNKRILQTAFSASFPQQASKEAVLETLCTLYSTHYSIQKDTVTIH